MAKAHRKMKDRLSLRRDQWEQVPSALKRGTVRPGSMKKKAKSGGKHV